jgi:hypothetical protein
MGKRQIRFFKLVLRELVPTENREFWDHVLIGEGSLWGRSEDCHLTQDASLIFGAEKLA